MPYIKRGKWLNCKKYCLNDVRLTKGIYDLYLKQHYLIVPSKSDRGDG